MCASRERMSKITNKQTSEFAQNCLTAKISPHKNYHLYSPLFGQSFWSEPALECIRSICEVFETIEI